jgi:hypothetical protein
MKEFDHLIQCNGGDFRFDFLKVDIIEKHHDSIAIDIHLQPFQRTIGNGILESIPGLIDVKRNRSVFIGANNLMP